MSVAESAEACKAALDVIHGLPTMEIDAMEVALRQKAEDLGLKAGQFFGMLRIATTGQRVSPP